MAAAKAAFARGSEWRSMDASERGKLINNVISAILIFSFEFVHFIIVVGRFDVKRYQRSSNSRDLK